MAEGQKDLDANEPATPFKLEKAHKRGSIVRSGELTFAFVLFASMACVYGLGSSVVDGMALLLRRGLGFVGREQMTGATAVAFIGTLATHAFIVIAPAVFVIWVTALAVAALQARGVFTAEPLTPDFSRVNPATGFKRLFSLKSLHELWRSAAKLAVLAMGMWIWGQHHAREILRFGAGSPRAMEKSGLDLLGSALTLLAALALLFALLDWSINRWTFMREMRMSRREMKDEHKEREGDPRIKSRLRELRLEWLKRTRQLTKVRSADVLLTNPTHYAVALLYQHGKMPAPMITARGAGDLALRMRAEARKRSVPIVEHPPLARALFALHDSQVYVPEEHFDHVARVLRWVYAARGGKAAASTSVSGSAAP
jgi:flagellar biosynthetic protein FlhB